MRRCGDEEIEGPVATRVVGGDVLCVVAKGERGVDVAQGLKEKIFSF